MWLNVWRAIVGGITVYLASYHPEWMENEYLPQTFEEWGYFGTCMPENWGGPVLEPGQAPTYSPPPGVAAVKVKPQVIWPAVKAQA